MFGVFTMIAWLVRAEGARQFLAVKAPVRRAKLHETRCGAGKNRVGP